MASVGLEPVDNLTITEELKTDQVFEADQDGQGDRETGGRVEVVKSAEEEEGVVADRICGDSGLWGEDARGRGPNEEGQRGRERGCLEVQSAF